MFNLGLRQAKEAGKFFVRVWLHDHKGEDFPEDDWFSIADNWDINLWTETEGRITKQYATIYPVVNSCTNTAETDYSVYYRVYRGGIFDPNTNGINFNADKAYGEKND